MGREGPRPALSFLRLQGFHAGSRPKMQSGPKTPPYSLGSGWVGQQSFRDFSITRKKKKPTKQNTRKPKSDSVQALEHLWHWPLRKSSCVSGRNLRSGRQGPGSAGPHSCLLGWALVRAAGGQSCVSGHPVGSGERGRDSGSGANQGPLFPSPMSPPPPVPSAGGCGHWAQG